MRSFILCMDVRQGSPHFLFGFDDADRRFTVGFHRNFIRHFPGKTDDIFLFHGAGLGPDTAGGIFPEYAFKGPAALGKSVGRVLEDPVQALLIGIQGLNHSGNQ